MIMLTKYQECVFLSAIMIFADIVCRTRTTLRLRISMPDGPDAIYIVTISAEILSQSLANFHCQ